MQTPSNTVSNSPITSFTIDKIGISVLLYAYASLLGAVYIFGYWRPIGFDIFPYISSIEYVTTPLNRLLVLIATPIIGALITFHNINNQKISNSARLVTIYLVSAYSCSYAYEVYQCVKMFTQFEFKYRNEINVLIISGLLVASSITLAYQIYNKRGGFLACAGALILIQLSTALTSGYRDGKVLFNGAENSFYLDNKEICEPKGLRDWVYLGKFSGKTFFMNTIDKRLCITDSNIIKLTSRKFSEKL